jgi:hypothetical protein
MPAQPKVRSSRFSGVSSPDRFRRLGGLGLLILLGCSGDQTDPDIDPAIQLLAGAEQTDTVTAEPVQALVVSVVGVPSGTVVRFESASLNTPFVFVSRIESNEFSFVVTDSIRSNSRASVRVKLGPRAGEAWIRVVVPEFGLADSARYSILPGNLAAMSGQPADTSVPIGAVFQIRAAPVDRFDNPRPETVSARALDNGVTISGFMVTANQPGRARVELLTPQWPNRDTVFVGVLPNGVLAGSTSSHLVIFQTDGLVLQEIPLQGGAATTLDWSHDASELALDPEFGGTRIRVVALSGTVRTLTAPESFHDLYPEYSRDGQWLYYSRNNSTGWSIRRVRPDGTGDLHVLGITGNDVAPSLSPDGTRMAYVIAGADQLRLHSFVGPDAYPLAQPGHTPAWSPDGERIAFIAGGGVRSIMPNGTGLRVLTSGSVYRLGLDWSPDGRWLVAVTHGLSVHVIEAMTGDVIRVPVHRPITAVAWRPE